MERSRGMVAPEKSLLSRCFFYLFGIVTQVRVLEQLHIKKDIILNLHINSA
jgi:hypothetical protein